MSGLLQWQWQPQTDQAFNSEIGVICLPPLLVTSKYECFFPVFGQVLRSGQVSTYKLIEAAPFQEQTEPPLTMLPTYLDCGSFPCHKAATFAVRFWIYIYVGWGIPISSGTDDTTWSSTQATRTHGIWRRRQMQ